MRNKVSPLHACIAKPKLALRKQFDRSPPIVFDELAMCHFAALCDGLRVIEESGRTMARFDISLPLQKYVADRGREIAFACSTR